MPAVARRVLALLSVIVMLAVPLSARAAIAPTFARVVLPKGGGEPNVSISPSGKTILVDGLSDTPAALYRSTDGGASFTKLAPTFSQTGGGDWDMRFIDDTHVIAADLGGRGILVHRSADAGSTWTTTTVRGDFYDRPWIEHDGANTVYLVAKGITGVPYLYTSTNGGETFGDLPLAVPLPIYGTGLVPAAAGGTSPTAVEMAYGGPNAYVDHLTVDQRTHDVYVLYGLGGEDALASNPPAGVATRVYVAHLEGGQMVSYPVHAGAAGETFISGFNWMTVDRAGNLYVLTNGSIDGHHSTRLAFSRDRGKTWSRLIDLGEPGAANVYGAIAGADTGVLSLVYLRGSTENPSQKQNWYVKMARVAKANTARPEVVRTQPIAQPIHTEDICFDGLLCGQPGFGSNRDLLDYIWNAIDPAGRALAVVASDGPATGGTANGVSVVVLRQTGGPLHGRGVAS
jgi:hypothetical protein